MTTETPPGSGTEKKKPAAAGNGDLPVSASANGNGKAAGNGGLKDIAAASVNGLQNGEDAGDSGAVADGSRVPASIMESVENGDDAMQLLAKRFGEERTMSEAKRIAKAYCMVASADDIEATTKKIQSARASDDLEALLAELTNDAVNAGYKAVFDGQQKLLKELATLTAAHCRDRGGQDVLELAFAVDAQAVGRLGLKATTQGMAMKELHQLRGDRKPAG